MVRHALRPASTAVVLLIVAACATNPATGKREFSLMSEVQEIELGRRTDAEVRREMGIYNDAELQPRPGDRIKIVVEG
jgi:predicted Zn-dependent protease